MATEFTHHRPCKHAPKVRVSTHADLKKAAIDGEETASIYSCDRPECLAGAKQWVRANTTSTGEPVVVPLPGRDASLPGLA